MPYIRGPFTEVRRMSRTDQKLSCSPEKDGVRCSVDHIVAEPAGIAHRQILFIGRDMGRPSDSGRRREVCEQFFGCEDSSDLRRTERQLLRPRGIGVEARSSSGASRPPRTRTLACFPYLTDVACGLRLSNPDVREFIP
jgi:hypothetical protein